MFGYDCTKSTLEIEVVLRPGFEPGSPAIFRYFNGERPEYLVHVERV